VVGLSLKPVKNVADLIGLLGGIASQPRGRGRMES